MIHTEHSSSEDDDSVLPDAPTMVWLDGGFFWRRTREGLSDDGWKQTHGMTKIQIPSRSRKESVMAVVLLARVRVESMPGGPEAFVRALGEQQRMTHFAAFIYFACRVRPSSASIIRASD